MSQEEFNANATQSVVILPKLCSPDSRYARICRQNGFSPEMLTLSEAVAHFARAYNTPVTPGEGACSVAVETPTMTVSQFGMGSISFSGPTVVPPGDKLTEKDDHVFELYPLPAYQREAEYSAGVVTTVNTDPDKAIKALFRLMASQATAAWRDWTTGNFGEWAGPGKLSALGVRYSIVLTFYAGGKAFNIVLARPVEVHMTETDMVEEIVGAVPAIALTTFVNHPLVAHEREKTRRMAKKEPWAVISVAVWASIFDPSSSQLEDGKKFTVCHD